MKRWTSEELSLLRRLASEGKSHSDAVAALNRSREAIRLKALELGVRLSRSRPNA